MKQLSLVEMQSINGGCANCKAAGKAAKKAWNDIKDAASHAASAVSGFWEGVFG